MIVVKTNKNMVNKKGVKAGRIIQRDRFMLWVNFFGFGVMILGGSKDTLERLKNGI